MCSFDSKKRKVCKLQVSIGKHGMYKDVLYVAVRVCVCLDAEISRLMVRPK